MAYTFKEPWPFIARSRALGNAISVTADCWFNDSAGDNGLTLACGFATKSGERVAFLKIDLANVIYSETSGEAYISLDVTTAVWTAGPDLGFTIHEIHPAIVVTESANKGTYDGSTAWPGGGGSGPINGGSREDDPEDDSVDYIDTASDQTILADTNGGVHLFKITNIYNAAIAAGQTSMWVMMRKDVDNGGGDFITFRSTEAVSGSLPVVEATNTPPGYGNIIESEVLPAVPGTTAQKFQVVLGTAFDGATAHANWKCRIETATAIDNDGVLQSPTTHTAVDLSSADLTAGDPIDVSATGLSANTTYYWQFTWTPDDWTTTYRGHTGVTHFRPSASTDTRLGLFGDDHVNVALTASPDYAAPVNNIKTIRQTYQNANNLINSLALHLTVHIGDGPTYTQIGNGSPAQFPINRDGTPNSATRGYALSQQDRDYTSALYRRHCRMPYIAPFLNIYGNRDRGHGFDNPTLMSGTFHDLAGTLEVTAKAFFGRPSGVGTSADADTIAIGDGSTDRVFSFDLGRIRGVVADFYRDTIATLTANQLDGTDVLPAQPDAAADWHMHEDDVAALFADDGPIKTFPESGLSWLVIFIHATPGNDEYSRDNTEEWYLSQAMYRFARMCYGYGIGRVLFVCGHNHFYYLSHVIGCYKLTLPMPVSYDKGLNPSPPSYTVNGGSAQNTSTKTIPPFVSNCGFVDALFGADSVALTYYRTIAAGVTANPEDGFTDNMDVVKQDTIEPLTPTAYDAPVASITDTFDVDDWDIEDSTVPEDAGVEQPPPNIDEWNQHLYSMDGVGWKNYTSGTGDDATYLAVRESVIDSTVCLSTKRPFTAGVGNVTQGIRRVLTPVNRRVRVSVRSPETVAGGFPICVIVAGADVDYNPLAASDEGLIVRLDFSGGGYLGFRADDDETSIAVLSTGISCATTFRELDVTRVGRNVSLTYGGVLQGRYTLTQEQSDWLDAAGHNWLGMAGETSNHSPTLTDNDVVEFLNFSAGVASAGGGRSRGRHRGRGWWE